MASTFERLKELLGDTSEVGGISLTRGQCAMIAEILNRATIAEAKPLFDAKVEPNILIKFPTRLERELLRGFLGLFQMHSGLSGVVKGKKKGGSE